ncbi:electron transport complex protein RnfG [Peptoniphilus olsenii]|uniref:Electron transport complex protein RnfG n=1 Tax=Peptoniphilus olsenii TaxID=411570 RepID=A0ABV2J9M7_9FIRM
MKEPVKFGIILLVFCAVSAGLLAYVNSFTAPVIAEAEFQKAVDSYGEIFGEAADGFEELDESEFANIKEKYPNIEKIFVAKKGEDIVGYGINVESNGFGGAMTNALGFLIEGEKIAGFRNISNQETSGYGTRITTDEYYPSYEGKSAAGDLEISKDPQADNEVMWLTSATVSSKGVLEGANEAVAVFQELINE